jgi:hypothetical protein
MLDVINLALPFFGLIFLGLACGKLKQIPETGLAWMNFFLIYVSLPCAGGRAFGYMGPGSPPAQGPGRPG